MKKTVRIALVVLTLAVIGGALIWAFRSGRSDLAAEEQNDAPMEGPSRAASEGGQTVLNFPADAQRSNGIVTARVSSEAGRTEVQASGVVLDLQPLLTLQANLNSASMEVAKAQASSRASQSELARLEQLNQNGKNASDKAVEAARAAAEADTAVEQNATANLANVKSSIALHWGPVLANWLEAGSSQFSNLISRHAILLQVNAAVPNVNGMRATVVMPEGAHVPLRLISPLPEVDARLQQPSYVYEAPARTDLVSGRTVPVFLESGATQRGVVIPQSSILWWQGKAWCYVEVSDGKFTRREVETTAPVTNGWFVTGRFAAGDRVVTSGAQALLSEEFRSQIQTDED